MKTLHFSIFLMLFLVFTLYLPNTFAQDYTQWHLPDGVKARLGKGRTTGVIAFSPDSTRLAVGSKPGIWIYDGRTYQELTLLTGYGAVNIQDLVLVASNFGKTGENDVDLNGDGVVSIVDLVLVAAAIGNAAP